MYNHIFCIEQVIESLLYFSRKSGCICFCSFEESLVVSFFSSKKYSCLYFRIFQESRVVFASHIFSNQLRQWIALKLRVQFNLNATEQWMLNISSKRSKEANFCSIMRSDSMTGLVWRLHELSKLVPRNFPVSVQISGFYHLLKSENISCLQFFLWHLYLVGLQFLAKLPHHGPQLTWIWYQWLFSFLDV